MYVCLYISIHTLYTQRLQTATRNGSREDSSQSSSPVGVEDALQVVPPLTGRTEEPRDFGPVHVDGHGHDAVALGQRRLQRSRAHRRRHQQQQHHYNNLLQERRRGKVNKFAFYLYQSLMKGKTRKMMILTQTHTDEAPKPGYISQIIRRPRSLLSR